MDQQTPTAFNERAGATLKRIRQSAGWSQADLAAQLAARGLPFQQQSILKVEKGTRPLKLEEAAAITELLGVDLAMLTQYVDHETAAEAIAQIQRSNAVEERTHQQLEQARREREERERQTADFLERVREVKRGAEDKLREAGGHQDDEGRWWWNGTLLALEVKGTDAGVFRESSSIAMVQGSTLSVTGHVVGNSGGDDGEHRTEAR